MTTETHVATAEIEAAIDWWAGQIVGEAKQDNGDAMQSALRTFMWRRAEVPTTEQVARFKDALRAGLYEMIHASQWHPDEPIRASAFRTVSVDYHPDLVLASAAKVAGIDEDRFPIKTVMWIDPGVVKVGLGYGSAPEVIYPAVQAS